MLDGGPLGNSLLLATALIATATVALAIRDVLTQKPDTRRLLITASAMLAVGIGAVVLLWPITASTGARCLFGPATNVFGELGSSAAVASAPDDADRASLESCIAIAHTHAWLGAGLILLAAVVYFFARRKRVSAGSNTEK